MEETEYVETTPEMDKELSNGMEEGEVVSNELL